MLYAICLLKLTKLKLRSKDFGLFSSSMGSMRSSGIETGLVQRELLSPQVPLLVESVVVLNSLSCKRNPN